MDIKTIVGATVIALALPFGALADPDEKADKISQELGLDDERAAQVEQILTTYHDGKKALKEQKKAQLKTVLSEEEMDKLKAMYEKKKDKHRKDME
ncbi:MAG: hypothetical protein WC997_03065 [Porticoccaceae bacterium]